MAWQNYLVILRKDAPIGSGHREAVAPGECLLVDNWNVLHRRRHFTGRRVIRRLWFDEVR
ncbi:MAG: TauD/TfdA family dioxygenase [Pseudonocardiales bacterium]|nr:TauD/TfdA family dioxygenase [Pseudonocardiales bacterium]